MFGNAARMVNLQRLGTRLRWWERSEILQDFGTEVSCNVFTGKLEKGTEI